jgi:hypothetical protein
MLEIMAPSPSSPLGLDALVAQVRELKAEVRELKRGLAEVKIDPERLWRRIGRYCEQTGDSERTARRDIEAGVLEVKREEGDSRRTYVRRADPSPDKSVKSRRGPRRSGRHSAAPAAADDVANWRGWPHQQMKEPPSG